MKKIFYFWRDSLAVFAGVFLLLWPISPWNVALASRDSGVFLYTGWRILSGEIPYRDVWDHKPPIIFYINALGLLLVEDSRWGVWFLEFFAIYLSSWIAFLVIKNVFGFFSSVLCIFLWLLTLVFVIQGGNFATEYSLPLQLLGLYFVYRLGNAKLISLRACFVIGLLGGAAFFIKQTAVGLWVSIVLCLVFERVKCKQYLRLLKELLAFGCGAFFWVFVIVDFFYLYGALGDFWSAVFEFNFIYISPPVSFVSRLEPIFKGIAPLAKTGLFQLSMVGYLAWLMSSYLRKKVFFDFSFLMNVVGVDVIFEIVFASASGKYYPHYYISILPPLLLFLGVSAWMFEQAIFSLNVDDLSKKFLQIGVVFVFLWGNWSAIRDQGKNFENVTGGLIVDYIKENTGSNDFVLVWGAESYVNYFSQRKSPSRFVYQFPLYWGRYADEKMIVGFLSDIIAAMPLLIVDTANPKTPMYEFKIQTTKIKSMIAYLRARYRVVAQIGLWKVYKRMDQHPS